MARSEWPEADTETLRSMWRDGHSAGEIMKTLTAYSRNAVIGKVHRLKLEKRRSAVGGDGKVRRKPRVRKPPARTSNQVAAIIRKKAIRAAYVAPPAEAPVPTMVTLMELASGQCKWALDDGPVFHFCGNPSHLSLPYCKAHAIKAYVSPNRSDRQAVHFSDGHRQR